MGPHSLKNVSEHAVNGTLDILGHHTSKILRLSFTYSSLVYLGTEVLTFLPRKIGRSKLHTQKKCNSSIIVTENSQILLKGNELMLKNRKMNNFKYLKNLKDELLIFQYWVKF